MTDGPELDAVVQTGSGAHQPSMQWVPEALSPGVKVPGHESNYLPSNYVEVKKTRSVHPLPHTTPWRSA
jgi:hypothetical protein